MISRSGRWSSRYVSTTRSVHGYAVSSCTGFDVVVQGLNSVGLRRAGFTLEQMRPLKRAFSFLYRHGLKLQDALDRIETEAASAETLHLVEFIRRSKRGIARPRAQPFADMD